MCQYVPTSPASRKLRLAHSFTFLLFYSFTLKSLMPRVSHQELLARLTKGKPIPALLLLGDEPFLRDASRAQLIETFVPEAARPWAVSRYSAARNEIQAALDQAQTLPMLAPRQVVLPHEGEKIQQLS